MKRFIFIQNPLCLVFVLSSFLLPTSAFSWTLTTSDFQSQQVTLTSLTPDALTLSTPAGPKSLPLSQFLELSQPDTAPSPPPSPFTLYLTTGDRLTGTPTSIQGESLLFTTPALGPLTIPLKQIRALNKSSLPFTPSDPPTEDTLTLSNGDTVKGIISSLDQGKFTVTQNADSLPVPLDSLQSISFASPAKSPDTSPTRSFRVKLHDGSSFLAPSVSVADNKITLSLSDHTARSLPLSSISSIEQVNGPVTFLSSLTPSQNIQLPYLGDPWPTRFNSTVSGQPLPHAIGVHSYSRLVYNLDPIYKSFRTQYAIEGAAPYANVTVRIKLDDKIALETPNVTALTPSPVILLPLNNAKTLTLEVDYGQSNDTQDRFLWLSPALLKTP